MVAADLVGPEEEERMDSGGLRREGCRAQQQETRGTVRAGDIFFSRHRPSLHGGGQRSGGPGYRATRSLLRERSGCGSRWHPAGGAGLRETFTAKVQMRLPALRSASLPSGAIAPPAFVGSCETHLDLCELADEE